MLANKLNLSIINQFLISMIDTVHLAHEFDEINNSKND